MSNFLCKCGFVIRSTSMVESHEKQLVLSKNVEDIGNRINDNTLKSDKEYYEIIDKCSQSVLDCPNCERLWISSETDGSSGVYTSYMPEPI